MEKWRGENTRPEQKVILDEKLHPIEIVQRIHGNAESIIEEFMLAANETVAQHMFNQHWPFIYRVHDIPNEEKMQEFAKLLANFNIKFIPKEETEPKDIQQAVKEGRAFAVWHHFYNSPFNVAAVQAFAKWMHPELFADLDPHATLQTFYTRFQPIPLNGVYWTGM